MQWVVHKYLPTYMHVRVFALPQSHTHTHIMHTHTEPPEYMLLSVYNVNIILHTDYGHTEFEFKLQWRHLSFVRDPIVALVCLQSKKTIIYQKLINLGHAYA